MSSVEWDDGWPGWGDTGRRVEMEMKDGTLLQGELVVEDWWPDGDGGETPHWHVRADDQVEHVFVNAERWRFLT